MDAWETLAVHSTSGDAWERLNGITGGSSETITHAYEVGQFDVVETGTLFDAVEVVAFDITNTADIDFSAGPEGIEFTETAVIEVI